MVCESKGISREKLEGEIVSKVSGGVAVGSYPGFVTASANARVTKSSSGQLETVEITSRLLDSYK